jgi:drug/metabolite transporter (DMT)-like permease
LAAVLALLAALAFALGTTLQQRGTLETAAPEGDPRFLAEIIREPIWLCGGLLQACGWVLQAVALNRGSLVVVQALCTLSLVFALPLGVRLTHQHAGRRSIVGALATVTGIVVFVTLGQPASGASRPSASEWWTTLLLLVAAMVLLGRLASRHRGSAAAALFATAAGLSFAFQAAVTKVFVTEIGNGLSAILSSWTTYALIASALAGFVLQQSALKTGYLAPAMAASNASTLVVSVLVGVFVFDEALVHENGQLALALLGLTIAVVGVIVLATTEHATTTQPSEPTQP